jgi:hypothetical protein
MSCELYISLTALDFIDEQVRIHWALSYFKGGRAASFAKRILRQELWSGKMCFASWSDFTEEFVSAFCPENEATTVLMRLKSDCYFQGKQNVEAYIDEFKDFIDLSGYTDPVFLVCPACYHPSPVSCVPFLSLIMFKIIPHPMTLLIAFSLQVIVSYFILHCFSLLPYHFMTYPLPSSHIPSPHIHHTCHLHPLS